MFLQVSYVSMVLIIHNFLNEWAAYFNPFRDQSTALCPPGPYEDNGNYQVKRCDTVLLFTGTIKIEFLYWAHKLAID